MNSESSPTGFLGKVQTNLRTTNARLSTRGSTDNLRSIRLSAQTQVSVSINSKDREQALILVRVAPKNLRIGCQQSFNKSSPLCHVQGMGISPSFVERHKQKKLERVSAFPLETRVKRRDDTEGCYAGNVIKHWHVYGVRYVTFQINRHGDVDFAREDSLVQDI